MPPSGGIQYTVVKGDSLWRIAERVYGDGQLWWLIAKANPDKVADGGNLILIGVTLNIPRLLDEVVVTGKREDPPKQTDPPRPELPKPSQAPGGGYRRPAVDCLYPTLKFDLGNIMPMKIGPIFTPGGIVECTLSLTGEISMQREGTCNPFVLDQNGYSVEASQTLGELTSTFKVQFTREGVTLGHEIMGPFGGTEIGFMPPSTLIYAASPRPVSGKLKGWVFTGKLGYKLEVKVTPNRPAPVYAPRYSPAPGVQIRQWLVDNGKYVVAGVIIVGAVVLVVGTLVEDILTLGGGIADDPISFAAAAGMFRFAVQFAR